MKSGNEEKQRDALLTDFGRTEAGVGRRERLLPAELDEQNLRNKASEILTKIINNPDVTIAAIMRRRRRAGIAVIEYLHTWNDCG